MKIYRTAALEPHNWGDRAQFLVMEAPRKEAIAWMDTQPWNDRKDLIAMTNEQERARIMPKIEKPLGIRAVEIVPSRDFIAVYHDGIQNSPTKKFPATPGKLESIVAWYESRNVMAFVI